LKTLTAALLGVFALIFGVIGSYFLFRTGEQRLKDKLDLEKQAKAGWSTVKKYTAELFNTNKPETERA
jgi:hypothetical protein